MIDYFQPIVSNPAQQEAFISAFCLDVSITSMDETTFTGNPEQVRIYPNPAHHQLTIDIDPAFASEPYNVTLFDMQGRSMLYRAGSPQAISLPPLVPGIYFLRLEQAGKYYSQKLKIE